MFYGCKVTKKRAKCQRKKFVFLPVSKKNRNFALVIQLGRHIEILLLDNDCVIVPDFGGFVAHAISARYDEADRMWLPPFRTLGFNPQLRINDSLLVQSYVTAYDISYPEALRRIEDEVAELKSTLDNEGAYTIDDIGTLTVNAEGSYQFEPCEAGILSPACYGLGGFEFPTLKEGLAQTTAVPAPSDTPSPTADAALLEFTDDEDDSDGRAISIKMSWVRSAVAIAAAVVAFFIMATPIANSDLGTRTMSQLQSNLLYKLIPQDTNIVPATPVAVATTPAVAASPADTTVHTTAAVASSPAVTTAPAAPAATYCIVLASQVKKSNAEYYVEQLKKQGYAEAQVYIHHETVRVIYGSYETEAEAYRQLNRMNDREEFADAWVYKIKTEA